MERDHWEDLGINGRISELILRDKVAGCGMNSTGSGYGPVKGAL
jgi:hypothetical protein